jgi:hypothetical protein
VNDDLGKFDVSPLGESWSGHDGTERGQSHAPEAAEMFHVA